MSKYSKELESMGYRVLNDIECGHSQIVVQERGDGCWVFAGCFSSRKKAVEVLSGAEL